MKVLALQGSPRKQGHTAAFSRVVLDTLSQAGWEISEVWLYDRDIRPCIGCKACQNRPGEFGCALPDDMHQLFPQAMGADLLLFSTPIYAFFSTPPVKTFLDRFIYASGKYYGAQKHPSLAAGKRAGLLTTCGYPAGKAVPMLEEALQAICKHVGMEYLGSASGRDLNNGPFMNPENTQAAQAYAHHLLACCGEPR